MCVGGGRKRRGLESLRRGGGGGGGVGAELKVKLATLSEMVGFFFVWKNCRRNWPRCQKMIK